VRRSFSGRRKVRKAEAGDVAALIPLVAAYWELEAISGFEVQRVESQLNRLLSEPSLGAGWIALADNTPIGYLLAVYVFSLEHLGLTAEIDEFFVSPSGRGAGVGSELLALAETEFARMGCTNVSLQLSRRNDAGRRFYLRHGYQERSVYELLDKMLPAG
jgi:GNAT superfamily N-acetyltransferase